MQLKKRSEKAEGNCVEEAALGTREEAGGHGRQEVLVALSCVRRTQHRTRKIKSSIKKENSENRFLWGISAILSLRGVLG